jgi:hypothetical protein
MTSTMIDFKIDILKQEIEIISEKVNHFDNLRHQTKQMAITLWLAAVGVGIAENIDISHHRSIPLLGARIFLPCVPGGLACKITINPIIPKGWDF